MEVQFRFNLGDVVEHKGSKLVRVMDPQADDGRPFYRRKERIRYYIMSRGMEHGPDGMTVYYVVRSLVGADIGLSVKDSGEGFAVSRLYDFELELAEPVAAKS